ncbi:hypothetical protein PIB30_064808 [Stylosanthes scabra]|uniref:Uncharacterized protein n=1 Tax=Stylosanthes scabra TaxID=79078 RepID=A0ABU6SMA5_9FABA|nr:hypothetical protein [Stylosanthes scabra]
MREAQKRTETQLTNLTELLTKRSDGEESNDEEEDEEKEGNVSEEVMEESENEEENEGETFFIATVFGGNKVVKNEIPAKCTDPGPSLVTCKIRGVEVRECMRDPGACRSVMPYELYELLDLGPLKKTNEVFTTVDISVVTVTGIAENVDAYAS